MGLADCKPSPHKRLIESYLGPYRLRWKREFIVISPSTVDSCWNRLQTVLLVQYAAYSGAGPEASSHTSKAQDVQSRVPRTRDLSKPTDLHGDCPQVAVTLIRVLILWFGLSCGFVTCPHCWNSNLGQLPHPEEKPEDNWPQT